MDVNIAKNYYYRKDVQKKILEFSKNREIAYKYNGFYSKRPQTIEYLSDLDIEAKKGVFSFHSSCELWTNPMLLGPSNSEDDKDKNRLGWDLILDIDGVDFFYSKIVSFEIVKFLEELGVKNVSIKFSGNKGFHIGVPFLSFTNKRFGFTDLSKTFPKTPRRISSFILSKIDNRVSKKIIKFEDNLDNISKKHSVDFRDFFFRKTSTSKIELKPLWWIKLVEIDTILISSRHLFRMPYSLNEKSGLISIPIDKTKIMEFERKDAKIDNLKIGECEKFDFLKYDDRYGKDGDVLLEEIESLKIGELEEDILKNLKSYKKAQDNYKNTGSGGIITGGNFDDMKIDEEVLYDEFPSSIKYLLENKDLFDGKKRALFVLLAFFHSINYSKENIKKQVLDWNSNLVEPIKLGYILSQINWFNSKDEKVSPPNFDNENYYENILIPKEIIKDDINKFRTLKIKNPLHYVYVLKKQKKSKK